MSEHRLKLAGWSVWAIAFAIGLAMILLGACAPVPPAALAENTPSSTTVPAAAPPLTPVPIATVQPTTGHAVSAAGAPKAYIGLFKDNAIAVLDTGTNRVLRTIPIPKGPHGLVITSDGRWVYASSDGDSKVSLIDTSTDTVKETIEVGQMPHGLAITPDGKQLLVAVYGTSTVAFIDTSTNQVVAQLPVPNPHNIAISPDGHTAYVAAQKPGAFGLAVLDVDARRQKANVPLDKTPRALGFTPDGKQLYFTLAGSNAVQVLDSATNQITTQVSVGASPHHPLFTPDGKEALVVAQGPGELDVIDPVSQAEIRPIKVGQMPHWIAITSDGRVAYVTNETSNDVSIVDIQAGEVTATIPVGQGPRKIVVQPGMSMSMEMNPAAPTISPAASSSAPRASSPGPAGATVGIANFAFAPSTLTVKVGQTVIWANNDSVVHTVTSDHGIWDSGDLMPGKSFTLTFDKPGKFTYHCSHHPYMQATVVVTG